MTKGSLLVVGAAIGSLSLTLAEPAHALGFTGPYAPANFTLDNSNANGFVNTASAPASITITGGDNGSFSGGLTTYLTTAAGDGTVSFDWNYFSSDSPGFDEFGYVLNGTFSFLANANGATGTSSFNVISGDNFGFGIATVDNIIGPGNATISNFSAPVAVPTPALLPGLVGMGVAVWRKRKGEGIAQNV